MSTDVLEEFTKAEIIQWIREIAIFRVRKGDLLFIRWQLESEKLQRDYQQEADDWDANKPDFSERDSLARQFNETRGAAERLALLEKMRPYDEAMKGHIERCKKLDRRQARVEAMYQQAEKQRDADNKRRGL